MNAIGRDIAMDGVVGIRAGNVVGDAPAAPPIGCGKYTCGVAFSQANQGLEAG